jgi:diguanylate cyclase (GGDEF)-like protein
MQQSSLAGKLLFLSALLTGLLIGTYELLPPKTWHWIPANDLHYHPYADDLFGGASYAERASPDSVHVRCKITPTGTDILPFCGFQIQLDHTNNPPAVDLRGYHTMLVNLSYTGGNEKLRFYIRDFEEGYSNPEDPINTAKYMSVYVPVGETQDDLAIAIKEFTVAEWWVNDNDVPREHSLQSFDSVVSFGVDVSFPTAPGHHELKLNKVTFIGDWVSAERWYLGILWCWVGGVFVVGVLRLYEFRRMVVAERQERTRLESYASVLQREKEQFQELSMVDQLTGALNRNALDQFKPEIDTGRLGRPLTLLLLDIDHFKTVNDTHGHDVGDHVLHRVGQAAIACSRQSDKVVRWGGEEFLVLLPDTPMNESLALAERLRQAVAGLEHPEVPGLKTTISIGMSEVWGSFDDAFRRADEALYRAKREGRNRVCRA